VLSERQYVKGLVEFVATMSAWEKRSGTLTPREWLEQYKVSQEEINFGLLCYEGGYPIHYKVSQIKPLCYQYGNIGGPFPTEPLDDIYFLGGQMVEVFSSVMVTTEHITSPINADIESGDAKILYFKKKMNGEYAWGLKWTPSVGILISRFHVKLTQNVQIGMSYEFVNGEYFPHFSSDHLGYKSIEDLEAQYGGQEEIIIAFECNSMINEYKLKKNNTVELELKASVLYDADGNDYGRAENVDGIYECKRDILGQKYSVMRKRMDRVRPQTCQQIREIERSPTMDLFRGKKSYRTDLKFPFPITTFKVGNFTIQMDDATDWAGSDVFSAGSYIRLQTYETLIMRLSRYHYRKYGDRLSRTPGLVISNAQEFCVFQTGVQSTKKTSLIIDAHPLSFGEERKEQKKIFSTLDVNKEVVVPRQILTQNDIVINIHEPTDTYEKDLEYLRIVQKHWNDLTKDPEKWPRKPQVIILGRVPEVVGVIISYWNGNQSLISEDPWVKLMMRLGFLDRPSEEDSLLELILWSQTKFEEKVLLFREWWIDRDKPLFYFNHVDLRQQGET
jgi:hypothetical protein